MELKLETQWGGTLFSRTMLHILLYIFIWGYVLV